MPRPPKSESPDEFLKRNQLAGVDGALVPVDPVLPTIDKAKIQALVQPKESKEATTGPDCDNCK
jgi:hypothetical protein